MGGSGAIYVLNMGQRVRIEKLAVDMIRRAGYKPYAEIAIKEVGLRPGEKLFEELVGAQESCIPTGHKMINRIMPDSVSKLSELAPRIDALIGCSRSSAPECVCQALAELVPEYKYEPVYGKAQAPVLASQAG
jgi:FlaA1/EpsC-like NDP-sugar epimerase